MTLTEIDILDEVDALLDAREPPCSDCGTTAEPRSACPLCKKCFCQSCAEKPEWCCDESQEEVFEDYGDESDPSPQCNCGTCSPGDYTCIRKD